MQVEESAPFLLSEKMLVFVQSALFFLQLTLLLILEDKLHRQLSYDLLPSRCNSEARFSMGMLKCCLGVPGWFSSGQLLFPSCTGKAD